MSRRLQQRWIRWLVLAALAAFVPLVFYLAVVGGLLPFGAIALLALRNLNNSSIVLFCVAHLAIYGALLYWLSGLVAHAIDRLAAGRAALATAVVLLLLAGLGALPVFGVAHGQISWVNAYALYASDRLR